jgi:hypothetical protein
MHTDFQWPHGRGEDAATRMLALQHQRRDLLRRRLRTSSHAGYAADGRLAERWLPP